MSLLRAHHGDRYGTHASSGRPLATSVTIP